MLVSLLPVELDEKRAYRYAIYRAMKATEDDVNNRSILRARGFTQQYSGGSDEPRGSQCITLLDPPPADPRVAHASSVAAE